MCGRGGSACSVCAYTEHGWGWGRGGVEQSRAEREGSVVLPHVLANIADMAWWGFIIAPSD